MIKNYTLEPNKFYQYSEIISKGGGYDIAYYYGIDPFYSYSVNSYKFKEDINFLLLMVDIIIFSPNTIFSNFKDKKYFDQFSYFWMNNTITTAIWEKYKGNIDEFVIEQIKYKSTVISFNQEDIFKLFHYNGSQKTVFLRNQKNQSIRYYKYFLDFYNTIIVKNNKLFDENKKDFLEQVNFFSIKDMEKFGVTFSYERLRKLLVSDVVVDSYSNEFRNEVGNMSSFIYFIVGAYTNNSYPFPEIPTKYLRLAKGITVKQNYLNRDLLQFLFKIYGICWADFCKLTQNELKVIRTDPNLIFFRKVFKKLAQVFTLFEKTDFFNLLDLFFRKSNFVNKSNSKDVLEQVRCFLFEAKTLLDKFLQDFLFAQHQEKKLSVILQSHSKKVSIDNYAIEVNSTIFDILLYLYKNKSEIISSSKIAEELSCSDSTVRCNIRYIKDRFNSFIELESTHTGYKVTLTKDISVF